MAKTSDQLREWRHRQRRGAIMSPATFQGIEAKAKAHGMSDASAKKEAGAAYWNAARSKFAKSKSKKT